MADGSTTSDPALSVHPECKLPSLLPRKVLFTHIHNILVNADDADLIIQSADNIQFSTQEVLGDAYRCLPETGSGFWETWKRSDNSVTGAFQYPGNSIPFIYPKKQPALDDKLYRCLGPLRRQLRNSKYFRRWARFISQHGPEILGYAVKYDYLKLADETAFYLLRGSASMSKIAKHLPPYAFVPWMLFYETWKMVFDEEKNSYSRQVNRYSIACRACRESDLNLPIQVLMDIQSKPYVGNLFHNCHGCAVYSVLVERLGHCGLGRLTCNPCHTSWWKATPRNPR
ncbi:hypothetical protein CPB84DRAFT_1768504 [Gymnopilus junonius]|uniref:Uncharacterized protein n=1 Tax=Gymnopilus junonius TaxID=109634 RepID=A0A9P5NXX1_GYMJU|nr:hypothetical protein CPB84DRAFT_1768504 [Gymnopilus junonius]